MALTILVLFAILMIGLKPKDFSPPNNATWLKDKPGIRFEKNSIAYTDSIADLIHEHISPQKGFSIEIALKPKSYREEGFNFIFSIHGGSDLSQLLIGQWHSSLIVMNGNDYNHRRKIERISFKSTSSVPNMQLLTVTTGSKGSKIYLDGRQVSSRKNVHLEIPDGKTARILLGNSVHASHPWNGEIYGVALFGTVLSKKDIETHFQTWSEKQRFPFAKQPLPFILFPLDEKGGGIAADYTGNADPLHLPARIKVLSPDFFPRGRQALLLNRSIFTNRDALLNFFGFIPLGFLLSATLIRLGGGSKRHSITIALVVGFFVSLFIETIQAWTPVRSSDLQDLILNTAGAWIGAASCKYLIRNRTEY
jgi:hypothetical protein